MAKVNGSNGGKSNQDRDSKSVDTKVGIKTGDVNSNGANSSNDYVGKGEGDYVSAKKFNDAETAFVRPGKVQKAAGKAAPESPQVARELIEAEQVSRARAKEEDPQVLVQSSTDKSSHANTKITLPKTTGQKKSLDHGNNVEAKHSIKQNDNEANFIKPGKCSKLDAEETAHSTDISHQPAQAEKPKR
jgi:hypothetical protein